MWTAWLHVWTHLPLAIQLSDQRWNIYSLAKQDCTYPTSSDDVMTAHLSSRFGIHHHHLVNQQAATKTFITTTDMEWKCKTFSCVRVAEELK